MNFIGKVVLITGAGSGIGADAAINFAQQGAKVVMVDLDASSLDSVAHKIISFGSLTPLQITADVTKDARRIIDETIENFDQLDILVNNAGILRFDAASRVNMDIYDQLFAVNVRAMLELTKLAAPHLEKTKGNVVNLSSMCALRPYALSMSYCMTKSAVTMYTKCAALELGPKGIRVNAINPGVIQTPIFRASGCSQERADKLAEEQADICPVRRIGNVSDTTNAILFLANDKSSFINGACLSVDGGSLHT